MDAFRPRSGLGKVMSDPMDGEETGGGRGWTPGRGSGPVEAQGSRRWADAEPAIA